VGTIIEVVYFPEARIPAYQFSIDIRSDLLIKRPSAQLTNLYAKEDLFGRQVIAMVDFLQKQIANIMGECLILGAIERKDVILL